MPDQSCFSTKVVGVSQVPHTSHLAVADNHIHFVSPLVSKG